MVVIAHAGHWALGVLQFAPVLAVAAFAVWRSRRARGARPAGRAGTP